MWRLEESGKREKIVAGGAFVAGSADNSTVAVGERNRVRIGEKMSPELMLILILVQVPYLAQIQTLIPAHIPGTADYSKAHPKADRTADICTYKAPEQHPVPPDTARKQPAESP